MYFHHFLTFMFQTYITFFFLCRIQNKMCFCLMKVKLNVKMVSSLCIKAAVGSF